ncbi:MAG: flagellar hook-associated protein FlgK [Planctomycetes bacterium]|nr:flagellar hook-associated protein FlgK [Planctomycetota bacterium]
MSLFGAVQSSSNALRVNQIGLQVVGNNIANANTPGYIRQELIQTPAQGYRAGDLIIGQGVLAIGVQQKVDNLVLDRLRSATSEVSYQEQLESSNQQTESLLNELSTRDFSSMLNRFSNAFQEISNQPGNEAMRAMALQRGQELSNQLRGLSESVLSAAEKNRQGIFSASDDINRLSNSIAKLNVRIMELEGGRTSHSDAVGLRDERLKALDELATIVNINVSEQTNGSVSVFIGGDFLLSGANRRDVKVVTSPFNENKTEVQFTDTETALDISAGRLRGLYDTAAPWNPGGMKYNLDKMAKDLINVVNRIHSQGQGTVGFRSVVSESTVGPTYLPLEQSNPNLSLDNGSFTITVTDARTNAAKTFDIPVRQLGLADDTTPKQLVDSIDAIDGLAATITNDGHIQIKSDSEAIKFSFSNDTSGVLAAIGINTFFRGNNSSDIEVRPTLVQNPSQVAVSLKGIGNGGDNAIRIAEAFTKANDLLGGLSLNGVYDGMIADTTRSINEQKGIADGLRNFKQSLEAQHLGISGVNLDEEAIKMMLFQRAFQATSRVIAAATEMLQTLVELV